MRILVTRPSPEAERTAAALVQLGHEPMLAPMLSIMALDVPLPIGPWGGIVMTSGNAARAVAGRVADLAALPVYAVGRQTAAAAHEAGFTSVLSADGDSTDLVALIATRKSQAPLLYLAGNDRARDLPLELGTHGIRIETAVVYRAQAASTFSPNVRAAFAQNAIGGVLHYSRRTAAAFCSCVQSSDLQAQAMKATHYCLSSRAAEPLAAAGVKNLQIASAPEESALFRLLPQA